MSEQVFGERTWLQHRVAGLHMRLACTRRGGAARLWLMRRLKRWLDGRGYFVGRKPRACQHPANWRGTHHGREFCRLCNHYMPMTDYQYAPAPEAAGR
jgi:hypothetical protein